MHGISSEALHYNYTQEWFISTFKQRDSCTVLSAKLHRNLSRPPKKRLCHCLSTTDELARSLAPTAGTGIKSEADALAGIEEENR